MDGDGRWGGAEAEGGTAAGAGDEYCAFDGDLIGVWAGGLAAVEVW